MSIPTLRQCPICDGNYFILGLHKDTSHRYFKDYGFTAIRCIKSGVSKTYFLGVFNKTYGQVICELCDSNNNKSFSRGLESSCITIDQLLRQYGQ